MRKLKQRLALTAVALAFTPITISQLIATNNVAAISLGAIAALFAGVVATFASVDYMRHQKW